MSAVDGGTSLTKINIPGAHNSASKNAMPFNNISGNQNKTVKGLLYSGVRYLDIRTELTGNG